ncbi:MAG: GtrA family protein [Nitrospirota bacterium]
MMKHRIHIATDDRSLNIFLRGIIVQFFTFAGVGVVGTAAHYAVLFLLVEIAEIRPVIASGFGFVTGAIVNYYLNYHITFRSNKRHYEAALKFFLVALCGLLLNTFIMFFTTELLYMNYLVAQVLATGLVLLWNFTCNRLWSFREVKK